MAQAIDDFRQNTETNPGKKVTALFKDQPLHYLQTVEVLPVFFVPADQKEPTEAEKGLLQRYLMIAQQRYKEMLKGRDTFNIAPGGLLIYRSPNDLLYFRRSNDKGGAMFATELMARLNKGRYDLPYVLVIVVMNPCDDFPVGGGIPINGGLTRGGGVVGLASSLLVDPNGGFMNTLQHELGHSFGLVHADVYGYNMGTSDSVMSYNQIHVWKGLTPPRTQAILIPEDIRALSVNKLVFPKLFFDEVRDVPPGYRMAVLRHLISLSLDTDWLGYRLLVDGKLVTEQREWRGRQAVEDLIESVRVYPRSKVQGMWGNQPILFSGTGYELYFDGERLGHEADWSLQRAVDNLVANQKRRPCTDVFGVYNGRIMP